MRLTAALILSLLPIGLGAALPAAATAQEVVDMPQARIYAGTWALSKDPAQNGTLSYLDQARMSGGQHFSVRCEQTGRGIRLAFPERLPGIPGPAGRGEGYKADVTLTLDGRSGGYRLSFVDAFDDQQLHYGTIYRYSMDFASPADAEALLGLMARGTELRVAGQEIPIRLAGVGAALADQAGYCN